MSRYVASAIASGCMATMGKGNGPPCSLAWNSARPPNVAVGGAVLGWFAATSRWTVVVPAPNVSPRIVRGSTPGVKTPSLRRKYPSMPGTPDQLSFVVISPESFKEK